MKRRTLLALVGVGTAATLPALPDVAGAAPALPRVHVFKSRYCGCCGAWVSHMTDAGFAVDVTLVDDTTDARHRLGMPDRYGSCHSASVGGYAIEGHVPAPDVKRLLAQRPAALGLAVPSMPPGAPGMDADGRRIPYDVFLVHRDGAASVFAHYPA